MIDGWRLKVDFFNKIKAKLKLKHLLWAIIFTLLAGLMVWLIISNGFSSDKDFQIGLRGFDFGIPIPNWLISCAFILMCLGFLYGVFDNIREFIKNTEFNKLICDAKAIGDINAIGELLSSLEKSKYNKGGDLRYNSQVVYYLKGTEVTIFSPLSIKNITTEIIKVKNTEENYVCVNYGRDVLKIKTSERNVLLLAEDMKRTLAVLY